MKKNMINLKNVGAVMRKNAAMFLLLEGQLGQQNNPACKAKENKQRQEEGRKILVQLFLI